MSNYMSDAMVDPRLLPAGSQDNRIYGILAKMQAEIAAPKNKNNDFGGYQFRNIEEMLHEIKPICRKYDTVLYLQDDVECIGDRYYVKATATLITTDGRSSISTTAYAREEEHRAKNSDAQVTGSCSSYARKYAVCGLFAISGEKDPDNYDNSKNYPELAK